MSTPAGTVSDRAPVDVSDIIERQRLRWFVVRLVLVSWLVTFLDGYDMNVIAFAAPYLRSEFALDTGMLTNVFGAGIAGALAGGFLFGFAGDRLGRRPAIIAATGLFGLITLLLSQATSYTELLVLRFANGLALGGAIPLIWALNIEYVATRYRATIVTLIMLGYGTGVASGGPLSLALIPGSSWRAVFVFGGVASLIAAVLLWRTLPESLRFLATRPHDSARMARIVRKLAPERDLPAGTRFTLASPTAPAARGPWWDVRELFRGPLRWVTPLLWISYAASSMTTYFFSTWGPLAFEAIGFGRNTAAYMSSMNSLAGAIGAVCLMRFTDRVGSISVGVMAAIAVPFLLVIGLSSVGQGEFQMMMAVLYFFLGGSHYGITSIGGTFYPTAHRALGSGWLAAVGKAGSIAGPWLGGWIMASHMPVQKSFALLASAPAVFAACTIAVGVLQRRGRLHAAA